MLPREKKNVFVVKIRIIFGLQGCHFLENLEKSGKVREIEKS